MIQTSTWGKNSKSEPSMKWKCPSVEHQFIILNKSHQATDKPETLEDLQSYCPCSLPLSWIKLCFSHLTLTWSQFSYIGIWVLLKRRQRPRYHHFTVTQQPQCSCNFSRGITKTVHCENPQEWGRQGLWRHWLTLRMALQSSPRCSSVNWVRNNPLLGGWRW